MKTCIVTGGAGFIGSHLCRDLLGKGYRVICMDNLCTGSRGNIQDLNGDFEFIETDVKDGVKVEGPVDFIFHLASRASPVDFTKYPIDILLTNSIGTGNALKLARDKNARFLLASTSEVYGDPLEHPQKETYFGNVNTLGPRACYDESKRFAESLTMNFHKKFGLDIRIARIFNTFGPYMRADDGRVIPNFINQSLKGEDITVYGDGKQTRSFCFVSDLVEGLEKLMFSEHTGMVFNLGSPSEKTITEVADIIKKLMGSNSEIVFKGIMENDPGRRKPDISRAKNMLGWEPVVNFEEGLRKTIKYFKGEK